MRIWSWVCRTRFTSIWSLMGHTFWNNLKVVVLALGGCYLEVIWGVGDPVGCLIFGALGGAVAGEQGFEGL